MADPEIEMWMQGNWQGVGIIVGSSPTIAVLWFAVREARWDFAEYLALNWPSRGDVLYAFALMAILFVANMAVASIVGPPKAAVDYLTVEGAGGLFVLLIAGCIVGPIMEEFVVRGVMFPRLIGVLPGSDRSHRADVGAMGDESYAV